MGRDAVSRTSAHELFAIVIWSCNRCKATTSGDNHVVGTAGAVNDQHVTALIKPTDDAHMGILRVKGEVAGDGLAPGNIGAVAMLHPCAASMSDHITAIADVIEHPIHEAGAIQAVGPYRTAAGTASCGDFPGRPPAGIPAEQGFRFSKE